MQILANVNKTNENKSYTHKFDRGEYHFLKEHTIW